MVESEVTKKFLKSLSVSLLSHPSLQLSDETQLQFAKHFELLSKWNKTHNLISVTDVNAIVQEHCLDSAIAIELAHPILPKEATIYDLGSGNGFPGLIGAAMLPDRKFVLVESLRKKCSFLRAAKGELSLVNVEVMQERVENLHSLQFAISRAAFSDNYINDLAPAFATEGVLALMRVPSDEFLKIIAKGPWMVVDQLNYTLDTGAERCVLVLRKKPSST